MKTHWLATFSGQRFDYANPDMRHIPIEDIAQGLSREARFCGQTHDFYTVAQHCCHAYDYATAPFKLEALLHDATEAFLKDIPTPLKSLLPDYKAIERRVDKVMRLHYRLPVEVSAEIKQIDLRLLATEKRDLMMDREGDEPWEVLRGVEPYEKRIVAWSPEFSMNSFLHRFYKSYGVS